MTTRSQVTVDNDLVEAVTATMKRVGPGFVCEGVNKAGNLRFRHHSRGGCMLTCSSIVAVFNAAGGREVFLQYISASDDGQPELRLFVNVARNQ